MIDTFKIKESTQLDDLEKVLKNLEIIKVTIQKPIIVIIENTNVKYILRLLSHYSNFLRIEFDPQILGKFKEELNYHIPTQTINAELDNFKLEGIFCQKTVRDDTSLKKVIEYVKTVPSVQKIYFRLSQQQLKFMQSFKDFRQNQEIYIYTTDGMYKVNNQIGVQKDQCFDFWKIEGDNFEKLLKRLDICLFKVSHFYKIIINQSNFERQDLVKLFETLSKKNLSQTQIIVSFETPYKQLQHIVEILKKGFKIQRLTVQGILSSEDNDKIMIFALKYYPQIFRRCSIYYKFASQDQLNLFIDEIVKVKDCSLNFTNLSQNLTKVQFRKLLQEGSHHKIEFSLEENEHDSENKNDQE
eukprot:403364479